MTAPRYPHHYRLRLLTLGLAALLASPALPASAQDFVSSNRTVAGGNPMNGNYSGQSVFVGSSRFATSAAALSTACLWLAPRQVRPG